MAENGINKKKKLGAGDAAWLVEGLLSILDALFSLSSTEYMLQWHMPVISALEWQRQQDQKFWTLYCMVSLEPAYAI